MDSPLQPDAWRSTYASRCQEIHLPADCLTLDVGVTTPDGAPIDPAPVLVGNDSSGEPQYQAPGGQVVYSPCNVSSMDPDPGVVHEVHVPSTATINVTCVPVEANGGG